MTTKWIQFRVTSESADSFRAALGIVETASRAEDGCAQYFAFQSEDDPALFTVLESWETDEFFEAHRISPHIATFKDDCATMIVEKSGLALQTLADAQR